MDFTLIPRGLLISKSLDFEKFDYAGHLIETVGRIGYRMKE